MSDPNDDNLSDVELRRRLHELREKNKSLNSTIATMKDELKRHEQAERELQESIKVQQLQQQQLQLQHERSPPRDIRDEVHEVVGTAESPEELTRRLQDITEHHRKMEEMIHNAEAMLTETNAEEEALEVVLSDHSGDQEQRAKEEDTATQPPVETNPETPMKIVVESCEGDGQLPYDQHQCHLHCQGHHLPTELNTFHENQTETPSNVTRLQFNQSQDPPALEFQEHVTRPSADNSTFSPPKPPSTGDSRPTTGTRATTIIPKSPAEAENEDDSDPEPLAIEEKEEFDPPVRKEASPSPNPAATVEPVSQEEDQQPSQAAGGDEDVSPARSEVSRHGGHTISLTGGHSLEDSVEEMEVVDDDGAPATKQRGSSASDDEIYKKQHLRRPSEDNLEEPENQNREVEEDVVVNPLKSLSNHSSTVLEAKEEEEPEPEPEQPPLEAKEEEEPVQEPEPPKEPEDEPEPMEAVEITSRPLTQEEFESAKRAREERERLEAQEFAAPETDEPAAMELAQATAVATGRREEVEMVWRKEKETIQRLQMDLDNLPAGRTFQAAHQADVEEAQRGLDSLHAQEREIDNTMKDLQNAIDTADKAALNPPSVEMITAREDASTEMQRLRLLRGDVADSSETMERLLEAHKRAAETLSPEPSDEEAASALEYATAANRERRLASEEGLARDVDKICGLREQLEEVPEGVRAVDHHQRCAEQSSEVRRHIGELEEQMREAARNLEYAIEKGDADAADPPSFAMRTARDEASDEKHKMHERITACEVAREEARNVQSAHIYALENASNVVEAPTDIEAAEKLQREVDKAAATREEVESALPHDAFKTNALRLAVDTVPSDRESAMEHHQHAADDAAHVRDSLAALESQLRDAKRELQRAVDTADIEASDPPSEEMQQARRNAMDELNRLSALLSECEAAKNDADAVKEAHLNALQALENSGPTDIEAAERLQRSIDTAAETRASVEDVLSLQVDKANGVTQALENTPILPASRRRHHQEAAQEAIGLAEKLQALEQQLREASARLRRAMDTADAEASSPPSALMLSTRDAAADELQRLQNLITVCQAAREEAERVQAAHIAALEAVEDEANDLDAASNLRRAVDDATDSRVEVEAALPKYVQELEKLRDDVSVTPADPAARREHHESAAVQTSRVNVMLQGLAEQLRQAKESLQSAIGIADREAGSPPSAAMRNARVAAEDEVERLDRALQACEAALADSQKIESSHLSALEAVEDEPNDAEVAERLQKAVDVAADTRTEVDHVYPDEVAKTGPLQEALTNPPAGADLEAKKQHHQHAAEEAILSREHLVTMENKLLHAKNKLERAIDAADQETTPPYSPAMATARQNATEEMHRLQQRISACDTAREDLEKLQEAHLNALDALEAEEGPSASSLDAAAEKLQRETNLAADVRSGSESKLPKYVDRSAGLRDAVENEPADPGSRKLYHKLAADDAGRCHDHLLELEDELRDAHMRLERSISDADAAASAAAEADLPPSSAMLTARDNANDELQRLSNLIGVCLAAREEAERVREAHLRQATSTEPEPIDIDAARRLKRATGTAREAREEVEQSLPQRIDEVNSLRAAVAAEDVPSDAAIRKGHHQRSAEGAEQSQEHLLGLEQQLRSACAALQEAIEAAKSDAAAPPSEAMLTAQDTAVDELQRVQNRLSVCQAAREEAERVQEAHAEAHQRADEVAARLQRAVDEAARERDQAASAASRSKDVLSELIDEVRETIKELEEEMSRADHDGTQPPSEAMKEAQRNARAEMRRLRDRLTGLEAAREELEGLRSHVSARETPEKPPSRRFLSAQNSGVRVPRPGQEAEENEEEEDPTHGNQQDADQRRLSGRTAEGQPPYYDRMLKDEDARDESDKAKVGAAIAPVPANPEAPRDIALIGGYPRSRIAPAQPATGGTEMSSHSKRFRPHSTNYADLVLASYVGEMKPTGKVSSAHNSQVFDDHDRRFEIKSTPHGDVYEKDVLEGRRYWKQENPRVIPHQQTSAIIDRQEHQETLNYRLHSDKYRDLVVKASEEVGGARGNAILDSFLRFREGPKKPIQQRRFYQDQSVDWSKLLREQNTFLEDVRRPDMKPRIQK